jgi:ribonuclease HI
MTRGVLYIDGAAKGNPGPAGCGVVIQLGGIAVFEGGFYLGATTNNVAEYQGLLHGMAKAAELGVREIEVRSDSELLVRQMTGEYKVKAPHLKPLWQRAREGSRKFDRITFRHVPREQNNAADGLANQAVRARGTVVKE